MKKKVFRVLFSLTFMVLCPLHSFADETVTVAMGTPDIEAELDELFGTSPVKEVTATEFEVIDVTPDVVVSQLSDDSVTTVDTPVRDEQFSLSLTENGIEYTLSSAVLAPIVELRSINGDVVSSVEHTDSDVVGLFNTKDLIAGYYIVRVVDSSGHAHREAYAVAVN